MASTSVPAQPRAAGLLHTVFALPTVLLATLLVLVFFLVPRTMADPDIWWHLRNAQILAQTHHVLRADRYSFTATRAPWVDPEWLAELPFYVAWRLGGPTGVYLVMLAAIECIFAAVFLLAWLRSRNTLAAFLTSAVAALLSTVSFGPRTLLFGWLCLLAELFLLKASARQPRWLWAMPPLFLLWINTHGSWAIGLVLFGIHICSGCLSFRAGFLDCESVAPTHQGALLLSGALSVAALFVTPYGPHLAAYPFDMAFHQRLNIANVIEWHSLDPHSPRGLIVLGSLAVLALRQLCRPRPWPLRDAAWLALALYSAVTYSRFLFLLAIVGAPIAAAQFPRFTQPRSLSPRINAALLFLLTCLVIARVRHLPADRAFETDYPAGALPALASLPREARLFHEFLWGGYLILNQPTRSVFIDSRIDLYERNGTFRDYLDIVHIHNSLALLDKYNISYILFEPDTPLVYLLLHSGAWKALYTQGNVILLTRSAAAVQ